MAIKGSIKKYQFIKALDIPTTLFLEVSSLNGKPVLVTEDLNSDNLCFVSPNSVKTETDELLACLRENFTPCLSSERIDSKAEQYCYKNKIKEISNFPSFYNVLKKTLSRLHVIIYLLLSIVISSLSRKVNLALLLIIRLQIGII